MCSDLNVFFLHASVSFLWWNRGRFCLFYAEINANLFILCCMLYRVDKKDVLWFECFLLHASVSFPCRNRGRFCLFYAEVNANLCILCCMLYQVAKKDVMWVTCFLLHASVSSVSKHKSILLFSIVKKASLWIYIQAC